LKPLSDKDIAHIITSALNDDKHGLGHICGKLSQEIRDYLVRLSDGDARMALNNLEVLASLKQIGEDGSHLTLEDVQTVLQQKALRYDKSGESHFNLISALHKSMRGSDPDAAIYWLGRMLASGEDPLYVARRMVRFATEDIGNADPQALNVALNGMQAYRFLGSPEGELALAQTAVYLATAPKSNAIYKAYGSAREIIRKSGSLETPLHIRNAPTRLMKDLGYGKNYQYAHAFEDAIESQTYLPDKLKGQVFYRPMARGYEKTIKARLEEWRRKKERLRKEVGGK
jgi:putative ATPase